ncbi:MAG: MotA/TolQ/ExbB proton channel family protein [Flavobacteriales bacterium AspAUS03]
MSKKKQDQAIVFGMKDIHYQISKNSSNIIAFVAPAVCIILGYVIWRFIFGNPLGFSKPDDSSWFWPQHRGPLGPWHRMYEGGIIVPGLIGLLLMVLVFSIERYLTISKATGKGSNSNFVRQVQYHLAQKDVESALAECDRQKGSVGNVMRVGLLRYKEMIIEKELTTEQKIMAIQKEMEEATALELPMMQKNLVFLSTITSLATLIALLGTVIGMIRSFSALGESGVAGGSELAVGISEALYNTATGIATSAFALITYNIFTTKIDSITYAIDESGFTLTQSFVSLYK